MAELQTRGIDAVFEQHGMRRRLTDFRRGRKLGPRDLLITLTKPKRRPAWMSVQNDTQASDQLTVRELKVGHKIVVTTLSYVRTHPKHQIKALYQQRWDVELNP